MLYISEREAGVNYCLNFYLPCFSKKIYKFNHFFTTKHVTNLMTSHTTVYHTESKFRQIIKKNGIFANQVYFCKKLHTHEDF